MDNLVPALAIICIFGGPIGAWIYFRMLAHQERMEMIRRGIVPPPTGHGHWNPRGAKYEAWAPGTVPPPPGVTVMPPTMGQGYDPYFFAQQQMRKGILVAFVGAALLIGLSFIGMQGDGRFVFGPWLLGGLIPMFVGIAQIINALMNGARFGFPSAHAMGPGTYSEPPQAAAPGPQPSSASAGSPPPPPTGPAGWRPGSLPEIERGRPPDVR